VLYLGWPETKAAEQKEAAKPYVEALPDTEKSCVRERFLLKKIFVRFFSYEIETDQTILREIPFCAKKISEQNLFFPPDL